MCINVKNHVNKLETHVNVVNGGPNLSLVLMTMLTVMTVSHHVCGRWHCVHACVRPCLRTCLRTCARVWRLVAVITHTHICTKKYYDAPLVKFRMTVAGSSDRTVKMWTFRELELLNVICENITSGIISMALSADNTFLALGMSAVFTHYRSFVLSCVNKTCNASCCVI